MSDQHTRLTRRNLLKAGGAAGLAIAGAILIAPRFRKEFDPTYGELVDPSAPKALVVNESLTEKGLGGLKSLLGKGKDLVDPEGKKTKKFSDTLRDRAADQIEKLGDSIGGVGEDLRKIILLSDEELTEIGREMAIHIDKKENILDPEHPDAKMISAMVSLQRYIFDGKAGRKLSVKVYNSRTVNAFALPDGSIRIYRGLIKELGENRTRAVFGHELGHVILDHSQDRMRHSILVGAGGKAAYSKITAHLEGGSLLANVSASILIAIEKAYLRAAFSRDSESEADDYAVEFLHRYGHDLNAVPEAFEKMYEISKKGKTGAFSSHPAPLERATRTRERIEKLIR